MIIWFYSILMTVIFLAEYNTRCYGVTFQINGCIKIRKIEDISDDEKNLLKFHLK